MSFTLSEVVPWGRSYDEYLAMFSLSPEDLWQKILGCGDGPAGFNSILSGHGGTIVSVDPIYAFTARQIKERINATFSIVLEQAAKNSDEFLWEAISSVEALGRIRMSAMAEFLQDFEKGRAEGRYLAGSLPRLPFQNREFGLALCSHLFFSTVSSSRKNFMLMPLRSYAELPTRPGSFLCWSWVRQNRGILRRSWRN